jgi:hypothetical protein
MRLFTIGVYVLSALVGTAFAVEALIFVTAVTGPHLWLLRSAGVILIGVVAAHIFPLRYLAKRSQIALYVSLAVVAAWSFGVVYYFAEIDDPFRSENELGSSVPFWTALFLSLFPVVRSVIRIISLRSTALAPSTRTL